MSLFFWQAGDAQIRDVVSETVGSDGFGFEWAALHGPDDAQMARLDELSPGVDAVGVTWLHGRIFGASIDLWFRIEGVRGEARLFTDFARGDLPGSPQVISTETWVPANEPTNLLLWDPADRRLPRGVRAPASGHIVTLDHFDDGKNRVWRQYLDVAQEVA